MCSKRERKTGAICGNFVLCSTFERDLFRDLMFIIMQRWLRHKIQIKKIIKREFCYSKMHQSSSSKTIFDIWRQTTWTEMRWKYYMSSWAGLLAIIFCRMFYRIESICVRNEYHVLKSVNCTTMLAISSKIDGMFKRANTVWCLAKTFRILLMRTSLVALILHLWSSFAYQMYVKTQ